MTSTMAHRRVREVGMVTLVARRIERLRPGHVGLLASLAALAIVAARLLVPADGDITRFVVAGDEFTDPATVEPEIHVLEDAGGYDGQFFWRLAIDPLEWDTAAPHHGVQFDNAYRPPRIVYPVLAWLAAAGQPGLVAYTLVGINVAAYGAVAYVGALLARTRRRPAVWGLLLAGIPGLVFALSRDLAEVVTMVALLAGVLGLQRGRHGWAAAAWTIAVLSREQAMLLVAGYGLWRLAALIDGVRRRGLPLGGVRRGRGWGRADGVAFESTTAGVGRGGGRRNGVPGGADGVVGVGRGGADDVALEGPTADIGRGGLRSGLPGGVGVAGAGSTADVGGAGRGEGGARGGRMAGGSLGWVDLPWLVPPVMFVAWQGVLWARLGELPLGASSSNLTWPFIVLVPTAAGWLQGDIDRWDVMAPVQLAFAAVLVGLAVRRGRKELAPDDRWLLVSLGIVVLLAVSFGRPVWEGPADLRQVIDIFTLSWLVLLLCPSRLPPWLVGATTAVWVGTVAIRAYAI